MISGAKTKTHAISRSNRRNAWRFVFVTVVVLAAAPLMVSTASAQEPDEFPPPLKVLSKEEKSQLNAELEPKKHTSLALELTESHLAKAEELSGKSEFDGMFKELGAFNAVVDEAIAFLAKNDTGSGKILNSSKKLEIGLRAYAPRLEAIRRDVPPAYEPYVRHLIKTIRDARSKAIEPFFGTSVVPEPKNN